MKRKTALGPERHPQKTDGLSPWPTGILPFGLGGSFQKPFFDGLSGHKKGKPSGEKGNLLPAFHPACA